MIKSSFDLMVEIFFLRMWNDLFMFSELASEATPLSIFLESSLKILSLFGDTYLLEFEGFAWGPSSLFGELPPRDDSPTFFSIYFL